MVGMLVGGKKWNAMPRARMVTLVWAVGVVFSAVSDMKEEVL